MKNAKLVTFLLLATLLVSGVAFAEAVTGKVLNVDQVAKSITVSQMDAATGTEKQVSILVQEATAFKGIADLAGLQAGAKVTIEATKDEASGNLKAESVSVA